MSGYTCIWAAALQTHNGLLFARGKAGYKRSFRSMQHPLSRIIWCLRYEAASFGPAEKFPAQRCGALKDETIRVNLVSAIAENNFLRNLLQETKLSLKKCWISIDPRLAIRVTSHQSSPRIDQRPHPVVLAHASNSFLYKTCKEISRSV